MTREIENARITSTMLGVEDHGILTAFVTLEYKSGMQSFGGYCMGNHDRHKRTESGFCADFIVNVLSVVGVEKWEDLIGKHVRADHDSMKVYAIGNLLKDEWFDPKEIT